jgi:hypothetical protein
MDKPKKPKKSRAPKAPRAFKEKRTPGPMASFTVIKSSSKVPAVNTEFELRPSVESRRKAPCSRKDSSSSEYGKLRACHVELVFDGRQPQLRFCTEAKKPGLMIPVANHREATALATKYCACVSESSGDRAACVPSRASLQGTRKRR